MPVNGSDVQRLSRGLLLGAETFVELLEVDEDERGGLRLEAGGEVLSLHLHRHEDGACALLVGLLDGTERCGAYAHRPGACRAYPATFDDDGEVALRADALCPRGGCGFAAMEPETWRQALLDNEAEWVLYEAVLEAWEERVANRPATAQTLLAWLAETYRRIDAGAAASPADLPALVERARQVAATV